MIAAILTLLSVTPACTALNDALARAEAEIRERYVIEARAAEIADSLAAAAEQGRYEEVCDDPEAAANRLTADLRMWSRDGHFRFDAADEDGGAEDWIARWRADGPSLNWGVARVERLEGNVGYIRLTSFYTYDMAREALASAFTLVRHTDALIIDARGNGGGDGETGDRVLDTLFDPDAAPLLNWETRQGLEPGERFTDLDWPRYGGSRPLAILIDTRSFSASEALAYTVQSHGRGVVIGEASAGGAHQIKAVDLSGGYTLYLPHRRPLSSATNANWEGEGVHPDHSGGDDPVENARRLLLGENG